MISNVAVLERTRDKFEPCILEDILIIEHIPVLESKVSIERKKIVRFHCALYSNLISSYFGS